VCIPGHGDELDLGIVGDGPMFGEGLALATALSVVG